MKVFGLFVLVQLCLTSVIAEESCGGGREILESACQYPTKVVLISSPNNHMVDYMNCDAKFNKDEWQQQPMITYSEAKPVSISRPAIFLFVLCLRYKSLFLFLFFKLH